MKDDFQTLFFKYYDRAISHGVTNFFKLNLDKDDFIKLCGNEEFHLPKEQVIRLSKVMELSKKETDEWLDSLPSEY